MDNDVDGSFAGRRGRIAFIDEDAPVSPGQRTLEPFGAAEGPVRLADGVDKGERV